MISRPSWRNFFLVLVALLGIPKIANCEPQMHPAVSAHARRTYTFQNQTMKYRDDKMESHSSCIVPPPVMHLAQMARFIVNNANWTAVATISSRSDMEGYPASHLISVSDGPLGSGSGIPYMYLTPLDHLAKDTMINPRASVMMSLDQTSYCKDMDLDPMDPRCARVFISGDIVKVDPESSEHPIAKKSVFERHPWLDGMPATHNFYFAKLDIRTILVHTYFGIQLPVTVDDYFNPPIPKPTR